MMKKVILIMMAAAIAVTSAAVLTGCGVKAETAKAAALRPAVADEVQAMNLQNDQSDKSVATTDACTTIVNAGYVALQEESNTNSDSDGDAIYVNYRSNSPLYRALYDTIAQCGDNGATGYTICKLHGNSNYFLVVSYGDCEAARYYDFYEICDGSVNYRGELGGAHTVACLDSPSGKLSLVYAHMGVYSYDTVWDDGDIWLDNCEKMVVESGEEYPETTGVITFSDIYNFEMIAYF